MFFRASAFALCLFTCFTAQLYAANPTPPASVEPPAVTYDTPRTVVWLNRTQVIPFRLAQPTTSEVNAKATITGDAIEVVREPAVLAGEKIGFIRVRGVKAGNATLAIGKATLEITVKASPTAAMEESRPLIVSPSQGAAAWGKIGVGVEMFEESSSASVPPAMELQLADGKVLAKGQMLGLESAPLRRWSFEVDLDQLNAGDATLIAVAKRPGGGGVKSEPLYLTVLKPKSDELISDECENHLEPIRRGQAGNTAPLPLGSDPAASGGRYVVCAGVEPAWGFTQDVKQAGLYQVIATLRGDYGGGALPSVGICFADTDRATTAARLPDSRWRRVPVGGPFALEPGQRVISVRFLNDFYAPDFSDRNLFLDKYELVRIDAPPPAAAKGDAMMMTAPMAMTSRAKARKAAGGDGMAMMSSGYGAADSDYRIAFNRPLHGLPLRGDLLVQGVTWWKDSKTTRPPDVKLLINGEPVMSQRAPDPSFRVNPGYFHEGTNTIEFAATWDDGGTAATPPQVLQVSKNAATGLKPRAYYRYGVEDSAWNGSLKELLTNDQRQPGHRVARFSANGSATLTLPDSLTGSFEVYAEVRGEQFEGPPIATVTLKAGEAETPIAEHKVTPWWNDAQIGKVDLAKGPKQLIVAFNNDAYKEGAGDRNLWIKGVSLRAISAEADRSPPVVKLLYPSDSQEVYMADAVVADVSDDDAVKWVDIAIDGRLQGERFDYDSAAGRLTFPLLARSLAPGVHRVKVRTEDRAGNQADSEEVSFVVLGQAPPEPGKYERAVRLLDRFAFGPTSEELADILTMGEVPYLQDRLSRGLDNAGEQAALGRGAVDMPQIGGGYDEVGFRVTEHLELTNNPVRARFVLWAENYFSTWIRKTESWRKWDEHEAFARIGVAPFVELLETSAKSPAMLVYLDQRQSFATRLNENYAREIMELHTLGVHGGYTQKDVTTLAGLLNGWTASEEAAASGRGYPLDSVFRYDPMLNDGQERQIVGMKFEKAAPRQRYDRVRSAMELLASHPSTAENVCRRLASHYVSDEPSDALVKRLAAVFTATGGDMREVMLAMAKSPEMYKADASRRVARPIDYAIRMTRTSRSDDVWAVITFLRSSGMGMFDHVAPNGYPEEDEKWADSNALLQRWRLAKQMEWRISTTVPGPWRWQPRPDLDAYRQGVVDMLAVRLTGRVLGEQSNTAAVKVLAEANGDTGAKVLQVSSFIAALPEASLR